MGNEEVEQEVQVAKKYIGTQAVKAEIEDGDLVTYVLENNAGQTVTKSQFEAICAEAPYDDGEVRIRKWTPAVTQIMGILLENNMMDIEMPFVMERVMGTARNKIETATAKLFGAPYVDFVTLRQVDKVLKS